MTTLGIYLIVSYLIGIGQWHDCNEGDFSSRIVVFLFSPIVIPLLIGGIIAEHYNNK